LAKFNDTTWTVYTVSDAGSSNNNDLVRFVTIDEQGRKLAATDFGLAIFNDTSWTVYNSSNSGLPTDRISTISIDNSGNKWVGTLWCGLVKYEDNNWTVYDYSNTGIHFNVITSIVFAEDHRIWVATDSVGIAVLDEGTVINYIDDPRIESKNPNQFLLYQNYPNPFNPSTTIEFNLPIASKVSLKIFNILGAEVTTLVSDNLKAGSYSYEWNGTQQLASGIYIYRLSGNTVHGKHTGFVDTRKMVLLK
jgi:hypothetical protein